MFVCDHTLSPSPLMSCVYYNFDVLSIYIYTASCGIACLAYHTAINYVLYQPLYPEFIVNCFDIERAAATFAQFAYVFHGKLKHISSSFLSIFWVEFSFSQFFGLRFFSFVSLCVTSLHRIVLVFLSVGVQSLSLYLS